MELARLREKPIREIAHDLGIAESCLRRWMKVDDVDAGRTEGTTTDEHAELVRLRRELRVAKMEIEILKRASATSPARCCQTQNSVPAGQRAGRRRVPVAVTCRVLGVSRSGFYEWLGRPPSARAVADAELTTTISQIHAGSRATYGAPRVHAELRLGLGQACGRKRVARLMRAAGLVGVCHRRKHRRVGPLPAVHEDLVRRQFTADGPDRLWATDITEHPTAEGKVYCAAVIDAYSRVIVGWSVADHMRTELVVDALEIARWRRKPTAGAIVHSDRGSQYTSWIFGHRLRAAGLLGSMGRVASSVDNTMIESFWSTMQRELLDRHHWSTRAELGSAIFEWIEGF
ncbi:Transposase InsO and inactivated derivatives [Klenkia soli]|uniref:Transposase InsO and inactivated derivatives n=1 Tax=Klenkia soli TaxID=1052260 RepID=A0A1H0FYE3_9ACTN|nr:Transposase InsO and inactivated derivatives [Klenkia soli]